MRWIDLAELFAQKAFAISPTNPDHSYYSKNAAESAYTAVIGAGEDFISGTTFQFSSTIDEMNERLPKILPELGRLFDLLISFNDLSKSHSVTIDSLYEHLAMAKEFVEYLNIVPLYRRTGCPEYRVGRETKADRERWDRIIHNSMEVLDSLRKFPARNTRPRSKSSICGENVLFFEPLDSGFEGV